MTVALTIGGALNVEAQTPTPPPAPAPAPAPAPTGPSINLGAVIFYDYTFVLAPETADAAGQEIHANGFNVARTYINVTGRISPLVSFRITPDIARMLNSGGSTDGSMTFRLKYGYAQFDLDQFTGAWTGTWIRAGMQQTPFIDGEESVYRYRFQGTLFAERDGGLSSADIGVAAHTNLPKGYGDVHGGIYNGEGYTRPEANDQKALMLRATVRPVPDTSSAWKGLRLTAYVHRDHVMRNAARHRFIGAAWFEHARFNAGANYLTREDRASPDDDVVDSEGYSFFVTPFLNTKGDGFEVLLRYDSMRSDARLPSARQERTIAGLAYWMPGIGGRATAALMLDVEQVRYRNYTSGRPTDRRLIVHGLINF
jgi:hypothetical protein